MDFYLSRTITEKEHQSSVFIFLFRLFLMFDMFAILQIYIRYKVKIGESADVIEAMAGVGAQSQVVRWRCW